MTPSKSKVRRRNFFVMAVVALVACAMPAHPLLAEEPVVVDPPTALVIKGALKWLAAAQSPGGSWSIARGTQSQYPVAMTGYVLMAFMAGGNLPEEGDYAKNVAAGMQFLLDSIQPDGTFSNGTDKYMYQHGIATIALAELYGQAKVPALRSQLERLVRVIITSQSKTGGWRYLPRPSDADISVSVLQVVALRAAKNGGIDVPQAVIDNAVQYVRSCYDPPSGGFTYTSGKKPPGFARTAAAIYSLQVCGIYDDPLVKSGSEYLFKNFGDKQYWAYGNYYAAPAQYMIGGETWSRWYPLLRKHLLDAVKREGDLCHWENSGGGDIGPVYNTAVAANILAIPYHYLPLYQR